MNIVFAFDKLRWARESWRKTGSCQASARQYELKYERLNELQLEVIVGILTGQDVFVVLPTRLWEKPLLWLLASRFWYSAQTIASICSHSTNSCNKGSSSFCYIINVQSAKLHGNNMYIFVQRFVHYHWDSFPPLDDRQSLNYTDSMHDDVVAWTAWRNQWRVRLFITFLQNGFGIALSPDPSSSNKRRGSTARLASVLTLYVYTTLHALNNWQKYTLVV